MNFAARLAGAAAALCLSFAASAVVAADAGTQPITDRDQCHTCDMWITKYAGPKSEIVTKNGRVYKFCSTKCMTCTMLRLGVSDKIAGIWVNDMAGNDWSIDASLHRCRIRLVRPGLEPQGHHGQVARLLQH